MWTMEFFVVFPGGVQWVLSPLLFGGVAVYFY